MDDRDFCDLLYQQWAKTTGAENQFWTVEGAPLQGYTILAVDKDQKNTVVADLIQNEADADFLAGLHGCVGDLVRRMHAALDEADRADRERDEQEQSIYALAVENEELKQEVSTLRRQQEMAVTRAGDVLWKIERPM